MAACANPVFTEVLIHGQYFPGVEMGNYLKLALRHGGNPNIQDENGETPIFYLFLSTPRKNIPERIHLLRDAGADLNHRNWRGATPVMSAMASEKDDILGLLRAGADYRIPVDNGMDLILVLERLRMPGGPGGIPQSALDREVAEARPVYEWLSNEGVNWEAARRR